VRRSWRASYLYASCCPIHGVHDAHGMPEYCPSTCAGNLPFPRPHNPKLIAFPTPPPPYLPHHTSTGGTTPTAAAATTSTLR
jgi:hypothetical protein